MSNARLETLTWTLIFGGLILVGLGMSVRRSDDGLGLGLATIGGLAAAVGVVLVYVRSRRR